MNLPVSNSVLRWAILYFFISLFPHQSQAQGDRLREYEIKAAYLYNFGKYVEWPAEALGDTNAPFVLGILGSDPFGGEVWASLAGQLIKERKLVIKKFATVEEVQGCHILFISSSEKDNLSGIHDQLKDSSILTVSENKAGIINFVIDKNRVRFEVDVGAAEQAKLKISAQLLKLAKVVR